MKKLTTLCLSLLACAGVHAQIYTQNFNTGSAADWTMNSSEIGGTTSTSGNQWLLNNVYSGGISTATASQPGGITGSPSSNYMHINCGPSLSGFYGLNANFLAGTPGIHVAAMNTPVSTIGFTNVNFNFWWLCEGDAASYGNVYYRTSTSGSWTQLTSPVTNYNLTSSWTSQNIHLAAFDNQATLEFAFVFNAGATGNDPAFAVDEVSITGTPSASVPTPSLTVSSNTVCQDSCITFTNATVGAIDSFRFKVVGVPITSNVSPLNLCFPSTLVPAGTYTMRLYVYKSGMVDSASSNITINPTPHPVITRSGNTFSVAGTYSSYKWYNGSTLITTATAATYTTGVKGSYSVVVDSGGCKGTATYSTLATPVLNGYAQEYRISQGGNTMNLFAASSIDEALTVNVYDATGRKMYSDVWTAGNDTKQISTEFFAPGMYMVRLSNNNTSVVLRWLK